MKVFPSRLNDLFYHSDHFLDPSIQTIAALPAGGGVRAKKYMNHILLITTTSLVALLNFNVCLKEGTFSSHFSLKFLLFNPILLK